ncbi:MAG: extracellular solute-binding protein [Deltaproteobacteria bacterium]|nr:extracellular solute-binding protein [Deltaproteobacteria bacterium]
MRLQFCRWLSLWVFVAALAYAFAARAESPEQIVNRIGRLPADQRLQEQIAGAKKEGKLLVYTSTAIQEAQERNIAFRNQYPFAQEVEVYRGTSERLLTKLVMESRSKKFVADLVIMNGADVYMAKKEGLLGKYSSLYRDFYGTGFIDPEGYWTGLNIIPYVMEYNNRLVSPGDVPKSLEGLLDERWRGKLALDDQEHFWFANVLKILGEKRGWDYMRKLSRQNVNLRRGHNLLNQLITAGEFPINVTQYSHITQRSIRAGAPVDWYGLDPIVTGIQSIAIFKNAPHPYTAMLYVDFMLSEPGQSLVRKRGFIPARKDVDPDPPRLKRGLKLVPADLTLLDNIQYFSKEFQNLFQR